MKKERIQGAVTAGVAIVGAGVMAAVPVAQQAPEALRAVNAQVELAAVIAGDPAELFALSATRAAQAAVGAPLGLLAAAAELAGGNNGGAYDILEDVIDSPLWAADPAIYALDDLLPAPIGGQPVNEQTGPNTSAITQFRAAVLIAVRDAIRGLAQQAVGDTGASVNTLVAPAPFAYTGTTAELFALSAQRAVQAVVGGPLGFAAAAAALAAGDNEGAYDILEDVVDSPLWAADPAIYAIDDLLPAPIGGDPNTPTVPGTGAITQFRAAVLIAARDALRGLVQQAVGAENPTMLRTAAVTAADSTDPLFAVTRLAEGFGESAVRTAQSAAAAPLGLIAVADGLQTTLNGGPNTALYKALQAYIDGPNYALDPIVFAVDDVLPAPIGGDPATDPRLMNGSLVSQFRANVLLAPRDGFREAVAAPLGVDPVSGAPLPASTATQGAAKSVAADTKSATTATTATKERKDPISEVAKQIKKSFNASDTSTAATTSTTGGKHRAKSGSSGLSGLFGGKKAEKKTDDTKDTKPKSDAATN